MPDATDEMDDIIEIVIWNYETEEGVEKRFGVGTVKALNERGVAKCESCGQWAYMSVLDQYCARCDAYRIVIYSAEWLSPGRKDQEGRVKCQTKRTKWIIS